LIYRSHPDYIGVSGDHHANFIDAVYTADQGTREAYADKYVSSWSEGGTTVNLSGYVGDALRRAPEDFEASFDLDQTRRDAVIKMGALVEIAPLCYYYFRGCAILGARVEIGGGNDMAKVVAKKKIGGVKIFMLRHGKPGFPDERSYIYGQTDYPLSEEGKKQAGALGHALSDIPMQRIISSDLSRAYDTARIVAGLQKKKLCSIERDAGLREINMGEWDGLTKDDIASGYVDIFRMRGEDIENVAPPGGESMRHLQERGVAAFERIVESSKDLDNILIVAHGAIMWSIVSKLFDFRVGDLFRFGLDFCALHILEHCGDTEELWGKFRLIRYNWSPKPADYMRDIA
jgi:probable phosphoglycerate mutase